MDPEPKMTGRDRPTRITAKQLFGKWLFAHLPITRLLFEQLRIEAAALSLRVTRFLPWRRRKLMALRRGRRLLVNVACGPFVLPGFVNIDLHPSRQDVIAWDCRRCLPLADQSAGGVRVEHFLEHLEPREEVPQFLRDVRRVLEPGGVLRIVVPDAGAYLRAYCERGLDGFHRLGVTEFPEDLPTRMDLVNHIFHQWHEHRWGYDYETLADRLRRVGFSHIRRQSFGQSLNPRLAEDREQHACYSLYVEAVR